MEWANLTSSVLLKAAEDGLPAILPVGSLEAHSDHLPLGNDTFKVDRTCIEASEREPAVVLPPLFYTSVKSMETHAGAVTLDNRLLAELVEKICDEAGRNGFRKVLIASGHGGNNAWLHSVRTEVMDRNKPYLLFTYYVPLMANPAKDGALLSPECPFDGHGGEIETSLALHLFPALCHMDRHAVARKAAIPCDLGGAANSFDWVASWPDALSGDPTHASAEKGKTLFESCVSDLARVISKIKADTSMAAFKDIYERRRHHGRQD